jgi:DNA-binding transcriptional regulator GbsR (MarR family)
MAIDKSTKRSMLQVANMVGDLIEFWGFRRNMGRLWCVLYLHEKPMSAEELRNFLEVSSGTISMTLGELQQWQVVRKVKVAKERREYFEAETDIWKMVSRVFRERELGEIQRSIEVFEAARKSFGEKDSFVDGRVKELLELSRIGDSLLRGILDGDSVNASPLAMLNLSKS